MKAISYGILAALFFAFTFVCNRSMDLTGGSWVWSASLRFIFMFPMLFLLIVIRGQLFSSLQHLRYNLKGYFIWSTIGFGVFYSLVCFSSAYGQGWLVASTWQFVIIAGSLIVPLFSTVEIIDGQYIKVRKKIPWRSLKWSVLILLGIALMQAEHAYTANSKQLLLCVIPLIIAAFAYPLGNRKMMDICQQEVDTVQRVFNMTLASLPFWFMCAMYGLLTDGLPNASQLQQSFLVALFSGVFATLLFFAATNLVRYDLHKLAAVEATQSGEVLFALLGEVIVLGAPLPHSISLLGIGLVIIGMLLHSINPKLSG